MSRKKWCVYVVLTKRFVKIGFTGDIEARMICLKYSTPDRKPHGMRLLHVYPFANRVYAMCAEAHLKFSLRRHSVGGEWYTMKALKKLPADLKTQPWVHELYAGTPKKYLVVTARNSGNEAQP